MKIVFPYVSQKDFDYALECLLDCKRENAKDFGFNYPYFTPGGQYGSQWWQLDSSLALCAYKWFDRKFAETCLLNFIESQRSDGRICLWGKDILPKQVAGNNFPKQTEGVSSLPKIFDVAYHILKGSDNHELKIKTYTMLKKYIDWWFNTRLDTNTKLLTAVFEETFIPYLGVSGEYAAVDTNVEVYVGCHYTSILAEELGFKDDAKELQLKARNLKNAINTYLWRDVKGAYYPLNVKTMEYSDCLMASTFYPLRLNIATESQKKKLLCLLKNDSHFNWNTIPLTSVSKIDKTFQTTFGKYQGNASWSGNVWTLINEMVIHGLFDIGETDTAIELALKTIKAFNNNYTEFINPFDGSGHGVLKYAWTASQFMEIIIEFLFGISFDKAKKEVIIRPNLSAELKNEKLSLEDINLYDDVYLNVYIENGNVSYNIINSSNITVKL